MTVDPFFDSPLFHQEAGSAGWAGSAGYSKRRTHETSTPDAAGSTGSASSAGSPERGAGKWQPLDSVRAWLARFICTMHDSDLDLLALWAVHTHLCIETYTSPRLLIDSPVPGSGKTTVLEHLDKLCVRPVQMASLSSPALMVRMLVDGVRTVLIDEADRSLSADKEGVGDLIAVLNSGYKRGATRPVLTPVKGGGWEVDEMATFAPVAMAGNNPNLPDDTRSRSIRVLLMPDVDFVIEDSDWEVWEQDALDLRESIASWSDLVRESVRTTRPDLPDVVRGRARERWAPLKRVAAAAGGRWPSVVDNLAEQDIRRIEAEKEDGVVQQRPAVVLLTHLHQVWGDDTFVSTEQLINRLVFTHPEVWGEASSFGKRLTPQRLGRMLATSYNITSDRPDANGPRGYLRSTLAQAFRRFGMDLSQEPAEPAQPAEPAPQGVGNCDTLVEDGHETATLTAPAPVSHETPAGELDGSPVPNGTPATFFERAEQAGHGGTEATCCNRCGELFPVTGSRYCSACLAELREAS